MAEIGRHVRHDIVGYPILAAEDEVDRPGFGYLEAVDQHYGLGRSPAALDDDPDHLDRRPPRSGKSLVSYPFEVEPNATLVTLVPAVERTLAVSRMPPVEAIDFFSH